MTSVVLPGIAAVIPAAGIGKRMQADKPKQYLQLQGKTILEHSAERIMAVPGVRQLWLALAADDPYFPGTVLAATEVRRVKGGAERVNSVLNALEFIDDYQYPWVLVHDAARPLVRLADIEKLIGQCLAAETGGILACRVRDTMKRGDKHISETVDRSQLWHALTPQFFPTALLRAALRDAVQSDVTVTDEASAMEWAGHQVLLVEGHSDNIKITQPTDLALAAFYLEQTR
ncbi:2-C-methyl-D-erythritol 4-phosphate cytidylyltransferase [Chromatiaceae bacterium AAb-1]|nr:2-C-methyl-D-erythritol 4-phosphate cytidylyltransferase [Chromatiaceae bacterium AAb-1]